MSEYEEQNVVFDDSKKNQFPIPKCSTIISSRSALPNMVISN